MFHKRQGNIQSFVSKFKGGENTSDFASFGLDELIFLAKVYANWGVYDKSIELFLLALPRCVDVRLKEEVFLSLANAYLKAGFLTKAEEVLNLALKSRSRNTEALLFLKYIYLKLRRFKEALSICDALLILGFKIQDELEYINLLKGEYDPSLMAKIPTGPYVQRFLYEQRCAGVYPPLNICIDLLDSQKCAINLQDEEYLEFFYAKGFCKSKKSFKNPKLKMLKLLNENALQASLVFSYHCKECKEELLIFSYHCPKCFNFGSVKISMEVKLNESRKV